jgi:hypothetical protein
MRLWAVIALAVPACVPLSASAQNVFYTTGTYTIDAAHSVNINDAFIRNVYVGLDNSFHHTDSTGHPYDPIVNLVPGGSINIGLEAYNSSQVIVSGGSVGFLQAFDNSRITVSGGSLGGVRAQNNSQVIVSSGSFNGDLEAYNSSQVTVSGGFFASYLDAQQNSRVTISGGTFEQVGGVNYLDKIDNGSSFTLVGYNLLAANARSDSTFGGLDYDLSGFLLDGTNLNGYVLNVQPGAVAPTLQNMSPPAVPVSGAQTTLIGLLGASGAAFLRTRRKQAVP